MSWKKLDWKTRVNTDNLVLLTTVTRDVGLDANGFDVIGTTINGTAVGMLHGTTLEEVDKKIDELTLEKEINQTINVQPIESSDKIMQFNVKDIV
jgi:hypothetical protein